MSDTFIHIISTRKLDSKNKEIAKKKAILIDDYEFLDITYLCSEKILQILTESSQKIVFTSKNAVTSIAKCLQNNEVKFPLVSCYTIKGVTEKWARQYGFDVVGTGVNGIQLAQTIIANHEKSVIHFTTHHSRKELPDTLRLHGIEYKGIEVYSKKVLSNTIKTSIDGILFFSPSQVDGFLASNILHKETPAFCIGKTTEQHLLSKNHHLNIVSETADEFELINTLIHYFKN